MNELFLKIINMSISASWLVLAVLLLRLILKKAPKWVNVLLWGIVAVRLVCPFSIESAWSLIPSPETFPEKVLSGPSFDVQTGIAPVDIRINDYLGDHYFEGVTVPAGNGSNVMTVLAIVWGIGILLLFAYTAISYLRLRRKVDTAVLYRGSIFQSENVASPFVLGIIKPRIYLPFQMNGQELEHVVAHEQAHIHRKDHWWKPLGFLLLTIHWFNPLMWLAYVLLCRDIELACDEKVIKDLGSEQRADYTQALVACSVNRRMIAACPLAFGEVDVKERVKSVMNYKKPAFWIIIVAVISCLVVAVCFLTNPVAKNTVVMGANYNIEKVLYAVTVGNEASEEPPLQYCVSADYHLYYQQKEGDDWNYLGALTPYELTNDELNSYMPVDKMRKDAKVRKITDAYILKVEDEHFYFVFQTKSGETYLAYGWEDVGERGQAGSDDTELHRLYLLDSNFHSGYVNVNFFQRSLINTVGNPVYNFANFESDKIPGYHIVGFKSGDSNNHSEMTDLGFAVFQTTGEGYRLINCQVYEDAALVENRIYLCDDPAVANINGEMRNDNTFDVVLILNEDVNKVERVYRAEGKEDWVQADTNINAPHMSLWSWEKSEGYTSVSQYFYDKHGNLIPADNIIPLNSASWENFANEPTASEIKEELEQYRTDYIGDATIVSHIAQLLPYPKGYVYSSIELQTSTEPYELIVYLTGDDDMHQEDFESCATIAFHLIGNMGIISFRNAESEATIASFNRMDYEENMKFYLTIGADGVKSIELLMPNGSGGCQNADGSLFKKGERIRLENLDGYADLCGLVITALDEKGEVVWSASVPNTEENKGFTHLTIDDWTITNIE